MNVATHITKNCERTEATVTTFGAGAILKIMTNDGRRTGTPANGAIVGILAQVWINFKVMRAVVTPRASLFLGVVPDVEMTAIGLTSCINNNRPDGQTSMSAAWAVDRKRSSVILLEKNVPAFTCRAICHSNLVHW